MARKSFLFADFNPAVWRAAVLADPFAPGPAFVEQGLAAALDYPPPLAVAELAPDGVDREELKTVFHTLPVTAHDAFGTFSVRHDEVRSIRAYAEGTDDDPSPDDVTERSFVQPRDFHLYEFRNNPGQVYVTTQEAVVRRVYRRARETHGNQGMALNLRNTSLGDLEATLNNAEIIGYKLVDVLSSTPIATYDVLGDDISNNREVQDAKNRAGAMKALAIRLQHGGEIIAVWVYQNSAVTFLNYPRGQSGTWVVEPIESDNRQLLGVGISHGTLEQGKPNSHGLTRPKHPGSEQRRLWSRQSLPTFP